MIDLSDTKWRHCPAAWNAEAAKKCDQQRAIFIAELATQRALVRARDELRRQMEDENAELRKAVQGLKDYVNELHLGRP